MTPGFLSILKFFKLDFQLSGQVWEAWLETIFYFWKDEELC